MAHVRLEFFVPDFKLEGDLEAIASPAVDHERIEDSLAQIGVGDRLGMEPLGDLIGNLTDQKADPFAVAQKIKNLSLAFEQQRFVHQHKGLLAEKSAEEIRSCLDFFKDPLRNDDAIGLVQISRAIKVDELHANARID